MRFKPFYGVTEIENKNRGRTIGGERGIRTLGTSKGTTVFETAPFDHSGISPYDILL